MKSTLFGKSTTLLKNLWKNRLKYKNLHILNKPHFYIYTHMRKCLYEILIFFDWNPERYKNEKTKKECYPGLTYVRNNIHINNNIHTYTKQRTWLIIKQICSLCYKNKHTLISFFLRITEWQNRSDQNACDGIGHYKVNYCYLTALVTNESQFTFRLNLMFNLIFLKDLLFWLVNR